MVLGFWGCLLSFPWVFSSVFDLPPVCNGWDNGGIREGRLRWFLGFRVFGFLFFESVGLDVAITGGRQRRKKKKKKGFWGLCACPSLGRKYEAHALSGFRAFCLWLCFFVSRATAVCAVQYANEPKGTLKDLAFGSECLPCVRGFAFEICHGF